MKRCRETISILLAVILLVALLLAAGWALLPKIYISGIDWDAYSREPENSIDVFWVGSSMVFCDVAPGAVYESSGITGYVVAGPEQTIPVSYYYIREACKTQSPKAIFVELGGMFFTRFEEHTASNIAFMPRGFNRLQATCNATNREDVPGLFLPVITYHSRWNSVTAGELMDKLRTNVSDTAGYQLQRECEPQTEISYRELTVSYYDRSLEYLKKISGYCEENGIELYLYFAPTMARTPDDLREKLEEDISGLNIAGYIDFNTEENFAALSLDAERDWVDGLHLNMGGAKKLSADFARRLMEAGFSPTENADAGLWQTRVEAIQ